MNYCAIYPLSSWQLLAGSSDEHPQSGEGLRSVVGLCVTNDLSPSNGGSSNGACRNMF